MIYIFIFPWKFFSVIKEKTFETHVLNTLVFFTFKFATNSFSITFPSKYCGNFETPKMIKKTMTKQNFITLLTNFMHYTPYIENVNDLVIYLIISLMNYLIL